MRLGAVVVAEVVFCGGGFYFLFFPHGPGPAFPNSANVDTIVCAHISNETSCSIHDIRLYDKDSHQVYVNEHCS